MRNARLVARVPSSSSQTVETSVSAASSSSSSSSSKKNVKPSRVQAQAPSTSSPKGDLVRASPAPAPTSKQTQAPKAKVLEVIDVQTKENRKPLGELNITNIVVPSTSSKSGGKTDLVEKASKSEKVVVSQKKLDIEFDKQNEELLKENPNRFVMFPLQHHDIWKMYKSHMGTSRRVDCCGRLSFFPRVFIIGVDAT